MIKQLKWSYMVPVTIGLCGSFAMGQFIRLKVHSPNSGNVRLSSTDPNFSVGGVGAKQDDSAPIEVFKDVLAKVRGEYVDKIDTEKKLSFGAVKTMLASLDDPKTRFVDPDQKKILIEELNGVYPGIGATVSVVKQKKGQIDQRRLVVVAPILGGPADLAGLEPGDIITEIDGKWVIAYDPRLDLDQLHPASSDDKEFRKAIKTAVTKLTDGISLQKALDQLAGKPQKTLKLTVERKGITAPQTITVAATGAKINPVEFKMVNDKTGYLRISQFNDTVLKSLPSVMGNNSPKQVVLDLRNNFGGPVTKVDSGAYGCALAVLSRFSPSGNAGVIVRSGSKQEQITIKSDSSQKAKVVVLVNGGTANLAELVAASLKSRAKAPLVGSSTFGDAIFQKLVGLNDGAAMTIATGKLLGPDGLDFAGKGLQPDVVVHSTKPSSNDSAVSKAVAELGKA